MVKVANVSEKVSVPSGVTVTVKDNVVSVSGPKGKQSKKLNLKGTTITHAGSEITVTAQLQEANTALAHIRNMLKGSSQGYVQKMKVIYAHFPIALEVKAKELMIKNYVGEKKPRKAHILGDTKVEIKGAEVTVSGCSRDDVGQTVANIRQNTRTKNRDSRVFQDGIYPVES